jgi:hypothetical protein
VDFIKVCSNIFPYATTLSDIVARASTGLRPEHPPPSVFVNTLLLLLLLQERFVLLMLGMQVHPVEDTTVFPGPPSGHSLGKLTQFGPECTILLNCKLSQMLLSCQFLDTKVVELAEAIFIHVSCLIAD